MEILVPKYRRDPNAMVHSLYSGVGGRGTVLAVTKRHATEDRLETTRAMGPVMPRGEGGLVAVLVLGGMETTLDEMEYILEARRQKKWEPTRGGGEIAQMCRALQDRRNEAIKHLRKNPSEAPKKRKARMYLPVGFRMAQTSEPGLRVRMKV